MLKLLTEIQQTSGQRARFVFFLGRRHFLFLRKLWCTHARNWHPMLSLYNINITLPFYLNEAVAVPIIKIFLNKKLWTIDFFLMYTLSWDTAFFICKSFLLLWIIYILISKEYWFLKTSCTFNNQRIKNNYFLD